MQTRGRKRLRHCGRDFRLLEASSIGGPQCFTNNEIAITTPMQMTIRRTAVLPIFRAKPAVE